MATAVTKRWKTKHGYLYIQEDECKGCGLCIEFCPKKVLEQSDRPLQHQRVLPSPRHRRRCVRQLHVLRIDLPGFRDLEREGRRRWMTGY